MTKQGRTFQEQVVIRKHVYDYVQKYGGGSSLRIIAEYVGNQPDVDGMPSPNTIGRLLDEYGVKRRRIVDETEQV